MEENIVKLEIVMEYLVKYARLVILKEKNQSRPEKLNYENFRNRKCYNRCDL